MPKLSESITIRAPIERVWAIGSDPSTASPPPSVRIELIPPGPLHVGQTVRRIATTDRGDITVDARCIEATPPRAHAMQWNDLFRGTVPFRITQRTTLEPVAGGTRIRQVLRVRAPNPIAWMIAWLAKPQWKQAIRRELEKLRDTVETQSHQSSPELEAQATARL